jgi:hypothetical protein
MDSSESIMRRVLSITRNKYVGKRDSVENTVSKNQFVILQKEKHSHNQSSSSNMNVIDDTNEDNGKRHEDEENDQESSTERSCKRRRLNEQEEEEEVSSSSSTSISSLDVDSFLCILQFLDMRDYASILLVNKEWNSYMYRDSCYFLLDKLRSLKKIRNPDPLTVEEILQWPVSYSFLTSDRALQMKSATFLNSQTFLTFEDETVCDKLEPAQQNVIREFMKLFKFELFDFEEFHWFKDIAEELNHLFDLLEKCQNTATTDIVSLANKFKDYAKTALRNGNIQNWVVKLCKNSKHAGSDCIDKDFILMAVSHKAHVLSKLEVKWKGDRDIVMAAVKRHPHAYVYASFVLQLDKELALYVVNKIHRMFYHIPETLKVDQEFLMLVDPKAIQMYNDQLSDAQGSMMTDA